MAERLSARGLVDLVLDDGSWVSWDTPPDRTGVPDDYAAALAAAADKAGTDESVVTGEATLRGRRVAVLVHRSDELAQQLGLVGEGVPALPPGVRVDLAGEQALGLDDGERVQRDGSDGRIHVLHSRTIR